MTKKIEKWVMFLNEFQNLPSQFVKNVKYMIKEEDNDKIVVSNVAFRKPLENVTFGEVLRNGFDYN